MTFQQIINDAWQRVNGSGNPPPVVQARLLSFLNQKHRHLHSKLRKLRGGQTVLTTVSGQQQYSLAPYVDTVQAIYDPKVNMRKLTSRILSWVREVGAQAESLSLGPPTAWVDMGIVPYQNRMVLQPSGVSNSNTFVANTGNSLFAVSSSASDTGTVNIEYLVNNGDGLGGYMSSANVVLTGVTPVQVGSAANIIDLTKFYLTAPANGYVTLHAANGTGTLISTLRPGSLYARFRSIILYPTPNSNTTPLLVDVDRVVPDAIGNSNDEPLLPGVFHWMLVPGILMLEYEKDNDARYTIAKNEWTEAVNDLESEMLNNDDLIIIPGGGPQASNYPVTLPVPAPQ